MANTKIELYLEHDADSEEVTAVEQQILNMVTELKLSGMCMVKDWNGTIGQLTKGLCVMTDRGELTELSTEREAENEAN